MTNTAPSSHGSKNTSLASSVVPLSAIAVIVSPGQGVNVPGGPPSAKRWYSNSSSPGGLYSTNTAPIGVTTSPCSNPASAVPGSWVQSLSPIDHVNMTSEPPTTIA